MKGNTTTDKIKEIITKIGELQAVKRHFDTTVEELESILEKKDKIESNMAKELEDINELEKMGMKSIFYKVLGNKEDQLEKERQEYLQVTLQHKEILNALEVVEFEKKILEKKMLVIEDLESELEGLKSQREKEIMSTPGNLRNELNLLFRKIDDNHKYRVELGEASIMGEKTFESLQVIFAHMKKARDWGNWDMFDSGRGRYHKSMKHNAIDRAMAEISRSKLLLRKFNKELSDVGYSNQRLALQVESIERFPGIIFDNLISDWIVQTKIKSVLGTIENLMDDVQMILKSLMKEKTNSEDESYDLERQKNRFLEEN
ncbi:MAG: hypothetical protein P1U56_08425 [Saprospiraceae bacterium]|nr:hypothetical protein [Saprospiraceae bacterium]